MKNYAAIINNMINDWNNLTEDEQANWFCGDGVYGFIDQETEKYGIELDEYQYAELASKLIGEDQYHKDCIERIKHDPVSLLIANYIFDQLTTDIHTWEQFANTENHNVLQHCTYYITDANIPTDSKVIDFKAIVEYVHELLDNWDEHWFERRWLYDFDDSKIGLM